MEQKLYQKFKESFVEMLVMWVILILIAGCLLVLSLLAYFSESDPAPVEDEQILWWLGFFVLLLTVSILGLVITLLRYGHDRKVLAEKKYEIYEGELAYIDIYIYQATRRGRKTMFP